MRRILSLLLLAISFSGVVAAPVSDKKIVVKSSNGTTGYAVKSIRSMKFSNGDVVMNLKDGESVTWSSDAVGCMFFDYCEPSGETSVGGIAGQEFSFDGVVLVVRSVVPARVALSDVAGKEIVNAVCRGSLQLRLNDYPRGVYILNIDGSTYKIINR